MEAWSTHALSHARSGAENLRAAESDDGGILIATAQRRHKAAERKDRGVSASCRTEFQPHRLLRDRNGGLWIGALVDSGLLHIHDGRTDRFTKPTACQARPLPLSSRIGKAVFGWRPRKAWTGFASSPSPRFLFSKVCPAEGFCPILAASDGSVWLGTSDGTEQMESRRKSRFIASAARGAFAAAPSPADSPWAAARTGSARFGRLPTAGCRTRTAQSLFQDALGQMWVGTQNGVAFLESGRFVPVASVPYGIVLFLHGGQCREPLDESSGGTFPSAPRACCRTHSLGQARAQRTGY